MACPDGTPVWFELGTPDQDQAQDFYEAVAGWRIAPSPDPAHGGYRIASTAGGAGVAGLMTPPMGMGAQGWVVYFAARDVDAMAETIRSLGGQIRYGPDSIPGVGRFAVAVDPQGVGFQILNAMGEEAPTAFRQGPDAVGHGVWIELATPDPDAAIDFYGRLFGWSQQGAMPMGDLGEYRFIGTGEDVRPGAMMSSIATQAPARWNWYVLTDDIDGAIGTAMAKGGTLIYGPDPIPGGDYSASLLDPHGSQIGIVGPRRPEAAA